MCLPRKRAGDSRVAHRGDGGRRCAEASWVTNNNEPLYALRRRVDTDVVRYSCWMPTPTHKPAGSSPRPNYAIEDANLARARGLELLQVCADYLADPDLQDSRSDWISELALISQLADELERLRDVLGRLKWDDPVPHAALDVFRRVDDLAMNVQTTTGADDVHVRIGGALGDFRAAWRGAQR